jgi:lipoprotein
MKHIGKVVGVLGVASACGLMALPLSTFAIEKKNSLDVNVTIASFLNIMSGASTVADTINPGQVKNLTNSIRVKTNSVTGYNINIRDKDSNINLVHDTTATSVIPALAGNLDGTQAGWNYSVGSISHKAITATDASIHKNLNASKQVIDETTNINYHVSATGTQIPGNYSDVVVLTVSENPGT